MRWQQVATACAVIVVALTTISAQALRTEITPTTLVEMALQRNREYLAAQGKISEAEALLRQAGIRPAPTIEIEAASGKLLGSSGESAFTAGYFHTIERGGKRDARILAAQRAKELAETEVQETRRQLTFEVKKRYVQAVAEEVKVAAIERLIPVNRQNYQMTVSRVELGDAAPLEQQLLLADVNRTEAQQAIFSSRYQAALLELKTVVGMSATDSLAVPAAFRLDGPSVGLEELVRYALEHRPDLRTLAALEAQASAEAAQARSDGKPDVTASARYSHINTRFDEFGFSSDGTLVPLRDSDNIATFGLAVPLFTKKRTEGAVQAATARQSQAQLRREHLMQVIPQEVEAAFRRWTGSQRTLQILKSGVIDQSEKNLVVIREAYRLGQLRLFDVMNEQRKLIETELSYVDAQTEAAQALVELERAVGGSLP